MKRYEIGRDRGMGCFMEESPTGEYHSRADLIAAGCLVPVLEGEAVEYLKCETATMLLDGDLVAHDENGNCVYLLGPEEIAQIAANRNVQPVRLVRLEDVG